jgi:hypothetical protein
MEGTVTASYLDRARRLLNEKDEKRGISTEPYRPPEYEKNEGDEKSPAPAGPGANTILAAGIAPAAIWWADMVPPETVPVTVIPPRECVGPLACCRLGVCGRSVAGGPCRLAGDDMSEESS